MRNTSKLVAAVGLFALAACTTSVSDPNEVLTGSSVAFDPYAGMHIVTGRVIHTSILPGSTGWFLRGGYASPGTHEWFQLYVDYSDRLGVHYFDRASDDHATQFHLKANVNEGLYDSVALDSTAVILSRAYLDNIKDKGASIKLAGPHDDIVIDLQAAYVQGFLEKLDQSETAAATAR